MDIEVDVSVELGCVEVVVGDGVEVEARVVVILVTLVVISLVVVRVLVGKV